MSNKRKIKFRGLRADGKGWVIGVPFYIKEERKCFMIDNCSSTTLKQEDTTFDGYEVDRHTVCQFTGLKDKKGKDIYEGDILETPTGAICFVIWDNAGFADKSPGSESVDWASSSLYAMYEVIGNIHDNPELIKQL